MAKSKSDILIQPTGQLVTTENGAQYFVGGNNRIKTSEHFAAKGRPLGDLIVDVIHHTTENGASARYTALIYSLRLWYNCHRAKVL